MKGTILILAILAMAGVGYGYDFSEEAGYPGREYEYILVEPPISDLIGYFTTMGIPNRYDYPVIVARFKTIKDVLRHLEATHRTDAFPPQVYKITPIDITVEVEEAKKTKQIEYIERTYKWRVK